MLSIDNTVMLLVDVQGQLAQVMHEKEKLFQSLEILIKGMNILEVPILWMEQIPAKLGPTVDEIRPLLAKTSPIEKDSFSCCREPAFMEKFDALSRNQVLITGIETHICVFQTGYELLNKGYEVQVVSDCVSSRTRENKEVGLQRIRHSGAQITSVEMVFFELMRRAKGDHFRQIVKLIK
ncbi:MAG: hydrolase [Desulfobacteraceae bacterium]|nr:hydrolase [Desulfobacteraceae bacterium]